MIRRLTMLAVAWPRRVLAGAGVLFVIAVALGTPVTGMLGSSAQDFEDPASQYERTNAAIQAATRQNPYYNVAALLQSNVKRMLAYSSIANAGYALLGVLGFRTEWGLWGVLVYLLAYAFMNFGAFTIVILLESKGYAAETVSTHVRVNLFNPGATRTRMRATAMPGEDPAALKTPESVAERILELCLPQFQETGKLYDFGPDAVSWVERLPAGR